MVKGHLLLLISLTVLVFASSLVSVVMAQDRTYHLNQEWAEVWIRADGTVDLVYNISITVDSGSPIRWVQVGQPKRDFTIGPTTDQYGNVLLTSDESSGSDYKVRVNLHSPLQEGQTIRFILTTNVAPMIFDEPKYAGYVGMQFTPTWWEEATVLDLRVLIVLPPNVTADQVKTTSAFWNNTLYREDRLAIYWEKHNLAPDEHFPVGVAYPKQEGWNSQAQPSGIIAVFQEWAPLLVLLAVVALIVGVGVVVVRKKAYLMPTMSMETLGIRRGLTAVEASYLLDMQPTKIVTEILYSLLQKRAVWVEATKPSVKLKVMPQFQDEVGPADSPLRFYEIDFLKAIKEDGALDEEKLAKTIMFLRDAVEEKLHGYKRRETIDYYRKIVAKAWEQVEQAGTPGLASNAYDEQLLWLLLDPNYQSRTETAFHARLFEPSPLWFWYWYGYQHYQAHPTYKPNIDTPAQSAKPPTIPGADFANNIATAVENTSNNIVANLEKFANAILPMPTAKASNQPAHHQADCVCACAACACACACVSCACACAGGGVG
jgi:hypothetical protein